VGDRHLNFYESWDNLLKFERLAVVRTAGVAAVGGRR
jgi:hypothetical protein